MHFLLLPQLPEQVPTSHPLLDSISQNTYPYNFFLNSLQKILTIGLWKCIVINWFRYNQYCNIKVYNLDHNLDCLNVCPADTGYNKEN